MDACERYLNAIHELVDGTLGPIRRAELELHLEICDGCRALAADVRAIATTARSLEVLQPPDRAWTSIAGRLRAEGGVTEPASAFGRHRGTAMLAIAAALVLAVGASLFMLRAPVTEPGAPVVAEAPGMPSGNPAPDDPVESFVTELDKTEQQLQKLVAAGEASSTVDAKTAAAMKKNLLVINEALSDTRKALAANPQSAPARNSLYEVLKQKIQFLQDTIALMNSMRLGDAAGAAEIVESGKS